LIGRVGEILDNEEVKSKTQKGLETSQVLGDRTQKGHKLLKMVR